jgi:hypothetical protein
MRLQTEYGINVPRDLVYDVLTDLDHEGTVEYIFSSYELIFGAGSKQCNRCTFSICNLHFLYLLTMQSAVSLFTDSLHPQLRPWQGPTV